MSVIGYGYDRTIKPLVNIVTSGLPIRAIADGLSDADRKIVEKKGFVAITQNSGFAYVTAEKMNSLGSHVLLKELPAYFDIKKNLDTAIDGGTVIKDGKTVTIAPDKALEDNFRVTEIYSNFRSIRGDTKDPKALDGYLNAADEQIAYIEKALSLNPENTEAHYEHISLRIQLLKTHLENAAKELGKNVSVWGPENKTVKECIADFNDVFNQGYKLNQEFESKKNRDSSLAGLKNLLGAAKSGLKPVSDMWDDPVKGRFLSIGTSYFLTHLLVPFVKGGLSGLNLPIPTLSLATLVSQPAITLYIDEALRYRRWLREKTPIDIFNFNNADKRSLGFGGLDIRSVRRGLDKDLKSEELTREVTKARGEIETNRNTLAKLRNLNDNLEESQKIIARSKGNITFDTIDDFLKEINEVFADYIIDGLPNDKDERTYLNEGKDFVARDLKNSSKIKTLLGILSKNIAEIDTKIRQQETTIRNDVHRNRKEGVELSTSAGRTRSTRAKKQTSVKSEFQDYERSDKKKFFLNLSTATIKNNKFVNLDIETEIFLTQLCDYYSGVKEARYFKPTWTTRMEQGRDFEYGP